MPQNKINTILNYLFKVNLSNWKLFYEINTLMLFFFFNIKLKQNKKIETKLIKNYKEKLNN